MATVKCARGKRGSPSHEMDEYIKRSSAQALHDDLLDARDRANYAESHPWRNLWAWIKRKLGGEGNERVS